MAQRRHTVSFYVGSYGTPPAPVMTDAGKTISRPEDPTSPGGVFGGWYTDFNCTYLWDFENDKVNGDMVLFAKWIWND